MPPAEPRKGSARAWVALVSRTTGMPRIGRKDGVINDGEGPFEQKRVPGREPTILDDGKGPLEEGENR